MNLVATRTDLEFATGLPVAPFANDPGFSLPALHAGLPASLRPQEGHTGVFLPVHGRVNIHGLLFYLREDAESVVLWAFVDGAIARGYLRFMPARELQVLPEPIRFSLPDCPSDLDELLRRLVETRINSHSEHAFVCRIEDLQDRSLFCLGDETIETFKRTLEILLSWSATADREALLQISARPGHPHAPEIQAVGVTREGRDLIEAYVRRHGLEGTVATKSSDPRARVAPNVYKTSMLARDWRHEGASLRLRPAERASALEIADALARARSCLPPDATA